MALINYIKPEEAQGQVAQAYGKFPSHIGGVPAPFQMMSASPEVMQGQLALMGYFTTHPSLDAELLASIRYTVSARLGTDSCTALNGKLLVLQGLSEEDLPKVSASPTQAPMEEKEKALLDFVMQAVFAPGATRETDGETLRGLGWSDREIFEAAFHGATSHAALTLVKAFKI